MPTELQEPVVFLENFISAIQVARKRVWFQAMVMEHGKVFSQVENELISASKRGVDVRINVDSVSERYVHGDLDLLPVVSRKKKAIENEKNRLTNGLLGRLVEGGVKITVMNPPGIIAKLLPVSGRNHIKMYIVDDIVWLGGLNFYDKAFSNLDFVVRFDQTDIVRASIAQFEMVNERKPLNDYIVDCEGDYRLVIDSGKRGVSLIYDEALKLVDSSKKSIVFVSQLVPEGQILDSLLEKACGGLSVTIITSHPTDKTFTKYPLKWSYTRFKRRIRKREDLKFIHLDRKVHAKLIIVDEQVAFFGSHNFVDAGVLMGTEEIAVRTRDTGLVRQLVKFAEELPKKYVLDK